MHFKTWRRGRTIYSPTFMRHNNALEFVVKAGNKAITVVQMYLTSFEDFY